MAAVFELEIPIVIGVADAFRAGRVTLQLPSASAVAATLTKSKGQREKSICNYLTPIHPT